MSKRYRVHLFPVIRITLEAIAADSPQQAIDEALGRTDLYTACQQAGHDFTEDVGATSWTRSPTASCEPATGAKTGTTLPPVS